jgi:hypothetical protein
MFARLPFPSHAAPAMTACETTIVSQTGPMIAEGLANHKVLRQNLPVGSAPSRANRARDKATQRLASGWHFLRPHRGYPTPSCFVSVSQLGGFLHAHPCGLASSRPGFPNTQESCLKSPGQDLLTWGGGGISPWVVLQRGTRPCLLPPMNSDPVSTQIVNRHCGVKSQTVR